MPGRRRLEGGVLRYVGRVHRLGPGDALSCFDPVAEVEADAVLAAGAGGSLECEIGELRATPYRPLPITLLQGLGKGAKPDSALHDATALGVAHVVFIESERAVVHLPAERVSGRLARWRRIAAEAARQSGRGNLPTVTGPVSLAAALASADQPKRILLVPGAPPLLTQLSSWSARDALAVLVGPEGGLSEAERHSALEAGFLPAGLGSTILRTELAAAAVLGSLVAWAAAQANE